MTYQSATSACQHAPVTVFAETAPCATVLWEWSGHMLARLPELDWLPWTHPEDAPLIVRSLEAAVLDGRDCWTGEQRINRAGSDDWRWVGHRVTIHRCADSRVRLRGRLHPLSPPPAASPLTQSPIAYLEEGVIELGADGRVVAANAAAHRLCGLAADALQGRTLGAALPAELAEAANALLAASASHGTAEQIWNHCAGEIPTVVRVRAIARTGTSALEAGCIVILEDRTRPAELEARLLATRGDEFSQLVAIGVVHDLKNILAAISCAAELSLRSPTPAPRLQLIHDMCARGARYSNQLLGQAHAPTTPRRAAELGELTGEALGLLRRMLPESTRLETELPNEPLTAVVSPGAVQQTILNLALNASQALRGHLGRVRVTLRADTRPRRPMPMFGAMPRGRCAVIGIEDDGPGMTAELRARLFQGRFTTRGTEGGHGLGLLLVRHNVLAHHGALVVESTPGEGSRFEIYLPLSG